MDLGLILQCRSFCGLWVPRLVAPGASWAIHIIATPRIQGPLSSLAEYGGSERCSSVRIILDGKNVLHGRRVNGISRVTGKNSTAVLPTNCVSIVCANPTVTFCALDVLAHKRQTSPLSNT